MSVRKGRNWGEPGSLSAGSPVVGTDAEVVAATSDAIAAGAIPDVGLVGGDLHRTLGSPRRTEGDLRAGRGIRYPIDLAEAVLTRDDGSTHRAVFCAHLLAVEGDRTLFGARTVAVMNAAFRASDNLGPRAHPGDGLLDLTDGRLGWWDRWQARRRLATGTHVPHPDLSVRRSRCFEIAFTRPATVVLDGVDHGPASAVWIGCLPDAIVVVA